MHSTTRIVLWAGSSLALVGTALAADMTGAEIKALISGKTTYAESTAASASGQSGQTTIFWAEDGSVLFKAPNGSITQGKWEIKDNTGCFELKGGTMACSRYDKQGDAISVFDGKSGALRAKIVKTAPGNAEKLAP